MATITVPLAAASLTSRKKLFSMGKMYTYERYNFDITIVDTDPGVGVTYILVGTVSPSMLLQFGVIGAARVAGQSSQFKMTVTTANTVNGVIRHGLMTDPVNSNAGGAASWAAFPEVNNSASTWLLNMNAAKGATPPFLNLQDHGLQVYVGLNVALTAGQTEQIKGYIELIGLDFSCSTDTV